MRRFRVVPGSSLVLASLLAAATARALVTGDVVVADAAGALVTIDPDTGEASILTAPVIGTGERTPGVGLVRTGTRAAVVVAPVANVPISEIHVGAAESLDEPTLVFTVPDHIEDVEGTTRGDQWYAVGDHLWQLHELVTLTGTIGVARHVADVAGPFQHGTALQLHETDDGGGGKNVSRILIAAGSDGVLLWDSALGTLEPFGGSPPSPTPPNDVVWGVADADDSLLAFGTTQLDLSGSGCTEASGLHLFALFGFAGAATGGPLRCALGLGFAAAGLGYATAVDDLLAGGNPRVVRLESDAGAWSASTLASGPPLSAPVDVEVVPEILLTVPVSGCTRHLLVSDPADEPDATPGNGVCASASGGCTLRAAVMEANAAGGRTCIALPAGTFALTREGDDDAAAIGDLDLLENVVIGGAGRDATILDADGIDRFFEVPDGGAFSVVLQNLGIRNGIETDGGAIRFGAEGLLALDRVALRDNRADFGSSGAIELDARAAATVRHAVVTGGEAVNASAIEAIGSLVVEDSTFAAELDAYSVVETFAPAAFVRTTFQGSDLGSHDCVVRSLGQAAFRNVTFSGARGGPAVCAPASESRVSLWNVTIAEHRHAPIFSVLPSASIRLLHTAVAAATNGGAACDAPLVSLGGNVDGDGSCVGSGPGDQPAGRLRLAALADNGGPTLTHAPRAGSALLEGGRPSACPARDQRGVARPFDSDGDGDARCDVGAVELVPEPGALAAGLASVAALARLLAARVSTSRC